MLKMPDAKRGMSPDGTTGDPTYLDTSEIFWDPYIGKWISKYSNSGGRGNKAEIIEKSREQKNLIKIVKKDAAQKKKKKQQQQKKRVKPQMKGEVIKEPRGPHDLGVIRRINTKKREVGKMSDIKRSKRSKTYHPPRWKRPYDSLPGSLRYIKDER